MTTRGEFAGVQFALFGSGRSFFVFLANVFFAKNASKALAETDVVLGSIETFFDLHHNGKLMPCEPSVVFLSLGCWQMTTYHFLFSFGFI
jgi:hypothetical protein